MHLLKILDGKKYLVLEEVSSFEKLEDHTMIYMKSGENINADMDCAQFAKLMMNALSGKIYSSQQR